MRLKSPTGSRTGNVFSRIRKFFAGLFMTLGLAVFIMSIMGSISFYKMFAGGEEQKPLSDQFYLSFYFDGALNDINGKASVIDEIVGVDMDLTGFLTALDYAANDDRVQGLIVHIDDGAYSVTQIDTIRKAVLKFRQSGKKTIAYAYSFGDFSNGTAEYWLASAFETIWVQPAGFVSINGILIEQPYARETLNKIGVDPEIVQRKSYKTGPETYLREGMSEEGRETLGAIAGGVIDQIVDDIAKARNLPAATVRQAINTAPLSAEDAYKFGLIDKIGYGDELKETVLQTEDDNIAVFSRYLADQYPEEIKGDVQVALIRIEGMILDEAASIKAAPQSMFLPNDIADAYEVSSSIKAAADMDSIKTILIRVNSPGGSPTASETIRHAVTYARDKGKYVIVSMGELAASGGYWVSVNANQIIASPLTITGSIGVYGGKMNFQGLWDKIGLNWDYVAAGDNATMWSYNQGYSAEERARLNAMMDSIYQGFVTRVAEGRDMSIEDVENVAQGRAWLGNAAKERNLVDLVGGFDFALKRAAGEAGGLDWKTMPIMVLPVEDDPFADLMDLVGIQADLPKLNLPKSLLPAFHTNTVVTAPYSPLQF